MSMIENQINRLNEIREELEFDTEIDCDITEWRDDWAKEIKDAISTIQDLSAKLAAANMERSSTYYNGGWIPIEKRLPTMEDVRKNDGRFILDDGNRQYQGMFDYEKQMFVWFNCDGEQEDKCCIAWCRLPEPYRKEV